MAAPEDADKAEVVQRNAAGELRGASRFVCAVAVVERPARTSHRREYLQSNKKKQHKSVRFRLVTGEHYNYTDFLVVVKNTNPRPSIYKTNGRGGPST